MLVFSVCFKYIKLYNFNISLCRAGIKCKRRKFSSSLLSLLRRFKWSIDVYLIYEKGFSFGHKIKYRIKEKCIYLFKLFALCSIIHTLQLFIILRERRVLWLICMSVSTVCNQLAYLYRWKWMRWTTQAHSFALNSIASVR